MSVSIVATPLNEIIKAAAAGASTTYDPSDSPLHGQAVFLVGAPRSGTTWLHQLLAVHPQIATAGESHVLCEGFEALFTNHADTDEHMNLSTWVSRAELLGLTRRFVDDLFLTVRDRSRPAATHVLDKTPDHRAHAALLAELYPDASFVHIIRDGRDMASSAHSLWSGIGTEFRQLSDAAEVWVRAITDIRTHLAGLRYHEVRYEELVAEPTAQLGGILDHLGLPHDPAFLEAAVAFGRAPINVAPSDARTGARKWGQLEPDAARAVALTAGDLLVDLGYATEDEMAAARAHRSLRTARGEAVEGAQRLVARARAVAARKRNEQRLARLRQEVAAVRAPGQRLAEAVVSGADVFDVAGILAPEVELRTPDGGTIVGADPVSSHLRSIGDGARISHVDADQRACAVQLVEADGVRRLHRYYVRDGAVHRIVVQ